MTASSICRWCGDAVPPKVRVRIDASVSDPCRNRAQATSRKPGALALNRWPHFVPARPEAEVKSSRVILTPRLRATA
jgi:hypothetical protein